MAREYARTVINQADMPNVGSRTDWIKPENAQNYVTNTYATGDYKKVKNTIKKPHTLYAYDFEHNLPSDAVVTSIKFQVRMRCSKGMKVKAPIGVFMCWDHSISNSTTSRTKTGWYGGVYRYVPSKYLTTNWDTYDYTISNANLKKYGDLVPIINAQGFGMDLISRDADTAGSIYVEWIRLVVEYEVPNRYVTFENASKDEENPFEMVIDKPYTVKVITGNSSIAKGPDTTLTINLPLGFELYDNPIPYGDYISLTEDNGTYYFNVKGKAKSEAFVLLPVKPRASGRKEIRVDTAEGRVNIGYLFVDAPKDVGFDEILVTPHDLRRGEVSCIDFNVRSQTSSSTYTMEIDLDETTLTENDIVSFVLNSDMTSYDFVGGEVVSITLDNYTISNNKLVATFDIPQIFVGEEFYLEADLCYYPKVSGDVTVTVDTSNGLTLTYPLSIAEPYDKIVVFNRDKETGKCSEIINLETNRMITQVEGDLDVIPIYSDEYDSNMYVDESTMGLNQWERVRYIGCVELPYAHYDPKHTTKDKLLHEHYKNKEYIGKENAPDEEITLKVKVPRRKTPTLIGLSKIDKPIPINLVPDAFEGDPLNHRGWAEFYAIEVTPTNPLYDTCDLDVKYITHNIISRFNIETGGNANPFKMPNVFTNSLTSGEMIDEFFTVTTDGSYIYDDEENNTHRNMFSINNQQDIRLTSALLASKCQFEVYWDTGVFEETRENEITRLIRIVNEKSEVVFEYEHYDFDLSSDVYSCRVIGRALTDNGFNSVINREVYIRSDAEYTENERDEYTEGADVYGSSTIFELDANKLKVREKGYSGYELEQEVTLLSGNYHLEIYWKNNNNDADTGNIISYMDFEINELVYDSQLSEYYNTLLVSPYPVPYKKIVFTRQCEEGTLYYLYNDGGEFSFLLEPYYQYKCGVDLVAEGSSIFDFNNSYPIIYIQNGLIRFGINRLNGDLYLDKWDNEGGHYVRTNRFRIDKYDDAEVTTINDDIIIVNISDINITMWRGRPYVMLQHETEDIPILDTFNQVFADGIGTDDPLDYPIIFNLTNSKNILPECIGGTNLIKSSCVTLTEEDDSQLIDIGEFVIVPSKTECDLDEDVVCTLTNDFPDGTVALVVNGDVVGTNTGRTITTTLTTVDENTIYAIYVGDGSTKFEMSNIVVVNVSKGSSVDPTGDWELTCTTSASTLTYNQGTVDFLLTHGGVAYEGMEIEVYNPFQTWHVHTQEDGKVYTPNRGVKAGKKKWVATVYHDGEALCPPCEATFKVVESTPQIKLTNASIKKGENATFRIVDESNNPLQAVTLTITIAGKKYTKKTSKVTASTNGGYVSIKMDKKGEYDAKVRYAGDKGKYNTVVKKFKIVVK